jgi:hypothetical protein
LCFFESPGDVLIDDVLVAAEPSRSVGFHRLTTRNLQSDRVHRPVCKQMKGTLRPRCRASSAAVIPSDDLDVADGRSCANGSVKASVDSPPENSAPPPIPCLRVRNLLMAHSAVDPAPEAFQPFGSFSTVMGTRTVMRSLARGIDDRFGSCVTSIAGPNGDAQLYGR